MAASEGMAPAAARGPGRNPFRGLVTFQRNDEQPLFGRERDASLLEGRVLSASTTLLFAGSGVGKSSFLNARFIPDIESRYQVCAYADWSAAEPLAAVLASVCEQLKYPAGTPLADAFRFPPQPQGDSGRKPGLLVLDQFEELFQYHRDTKELASLIRELGKLVSDPQSEVRLLLSMREEFLGDLSAFDGVIPDLFNNYYRLRNPSDALAAAILRQTAETEKVPCDEEGMNRLIQDLQNFGPPVLRSATLAHRSVPLPYLQVVCRGLWDNTPPGEAVPFLTNYKAGEAKVELDKYCKEKLKVLTEDEKEAVSDSFGYLITRGGAKRAYRLTDLVDLIGISSNATLRSGLNKLAGEDSRILRRFRDPDDIYWYELYHDMYAQFLSDWKAGVEAERKRRREELAIELKKRENEARLRQEELAHERKFKRLYRLAGALAAVLILAGPIWFTWRSFEILRHPEGQDYARIQQAHHWYTATGLALAFPAPGRWWTRYLESLVQTELTQGNLDKAALLQLKLLTVDDDTEAQRRRAAELLSGPVERREFTIRTSVTLDRAVLSPDGGTLVGWAGTTVYEYGLNLVLRRSMIRGAIKIVPAESEGTIATPARSDRSGLRILSINAARMQVVAVMERADTAAGANQRRLEFLLLDARTGRALGQPLALKEIAAGRPGAEFVGTTIAAYSPTAVCLLSSADDKLTLRSCVEKTTGGALAVSDDGSWVAIQSTAGALTVMDTRAGTRRVIRGQARLRDRFPPGSMIAGHELMAWLSPFLPDVLVNLRTGSVVALPADLSRAFAFSADDRMLYAGEPPGTRALSMPDGKTVLTSDSPVDGTLYPALGLMVRIESNAVQISRMPELVPPSRDKQLLGVSADLGVVAIKASQSVDFVRPADLAFLAKVPMVVNWAALVSPNYFSLAPDGTAAYIRPRYFRLKDGSYQDRRPNLMLAKGAALFVDESSSCLLSSPGQKEDQDLGQCAAYGSDARGKVLFSLNNGEFKTRASDAGWRVGLQGKFPEPLSGSMRLDQAGRRLVVAGTTRPRSVWTLGEKCTRTVLPYAAGSVVFGPGPKCVTGASGAGVSVWLVRSANDVRPSEIQFGGRSPSLTSAFDESAVFVVTDNQIHRITLTGEDKVEVRTRLASGPVSQIAAASSDAVTALVGSDWRVETIRFDSSSVPPIAKPSGGWARLLDEWQRRLGYEFQNGEFKPEAPPAQR